VLSTVGNLAVDCVLAFGPDLPEALSRRGSELVVAYTPGRAETGLRLLDAVRGPGRGANGVRIVLVGGSGEPGIAAEALRRGARGYLVDSLPAAQCDVSSRHPARSGCSSAALAFRSSAGVSAQLVCGAARPGMTAFMIARQSGTRWAVQLSMARRGDRRTWGMASGDFERALAAQASSIVIGPPSTQKPGAAGTMSA
jgi:hypothetical protein